MWCYEKFSAKPLLIFVCVMVSPHPPPPSPNCLYLFKSSVWQIIVHLPAGKTVNPAALCPPHHPSSSPSPQPLESNALDPLFVLMSEVSLTVTAPPPHTHRHAHTIPGSGLGNDWSHPGLGLQEIPYFVDPRSKCLLGWEEFSKREESALLPSPRGCRKVSHLREERRIS